MDWHSLRGSEWYCSSRMKSFRLDSDHFTKMFDKFTISNGMAWNLNNTKINFNDSEGRKIYVFDYELKRGTISKRFA